MLFLGKYNELTIERLTSVGLYLSEPEGAEVLLPNKYVTEDMQVGETTRVFVYKDSEDRPVATTQTPKLLRNEFGYLAVKEVNSYGAFLDWGLEKDLFVPYSEQVTPMRAGESYIVFLYLDRRTDRLLATAKWRQNLDNERLLVQEGDEVELLVAERTDLGYNVIINNYHIGLVFYNDVFKKVTVGQRTTGYVRTIRDGNKIDVSLEKIGYEKTEGHADRIYELLKSNGGFLALNDTSSPEEIERALEMSKKNFKKAIGGLYKKGVITLEQEGIRLVR
ncbi:S1-like domain-containing RNA-binding protein [Ravibacter arvi]|uniref:S1-like domain-containing RNA-binding protein n=1 Tax=Ravibacter arvi TaxID=2051041 RepID=A0ABP8LY34_9BACT